MQNFENQIVIRRAEKKDEAALAELAYRAYFDRFFNPKVTDKAGASLRIYPELVPDEKQDTGQSLSTFRDYWRKAMPKLDQKDGGFICYVAELKSAKGNRIVGFRKGYAAPLEEAEYQRYVRENKKRLLLNKRNDYYGIDPYDDLRPIPLPAKEKIAGSSSLYIDPAFKREGLGRRLIQTYAKEVLQRGFEGMMSSCYIYNDSQKFLRSVGGDFFIRCDIPVVYKKQDKSSDIYNIPGLMCLWDKAALQKLAQKSVTEKRISLPQFSSAYAR